MSTVTSHPTRLCPYCGAETRWEQNRWRPFCSERCKLSDLGIWADEGYKIPGAAHHFTEEQEQD